jgi:signal transduction histidine kinase
VWLLAYYLLAGFTLLTVVMSLYLSHHLMQRYRRTVASNQEWATRLGEYTELGQLAALINMPGNVVLASQDVETESARLHMLLRLFATRLAALQEDLHTHVDAIQAVPLLEDLHTVNDAVSALAGEADLLFASLRQQESAQIEQRLAQMHRFYADATTALATLREDVHLVQNALFETQTAAAADLQKYEYVIAGGILIAVCGAMVYGRKLAQRMARLEALRLAKEAAEEASRAKSALLANMSHELRTPLHHIIGFTRLVMRHAQAVLPMRQYANLEKILHSAEHLSELINDILDLSTLEAGQVEVQPVSFALEPLVDTCLHTVAPLVKEKQLRLLKELDPDLPMLYTDPTMLKHMLTHLLHNAVKFTEAGTVTVTAQHQGEMLTVAVADTGIGIPEEACERIFEAFRQVDSSTTRQFGGSGLGLAICRRLAHLLGGEVTVQSTVGVGSTFTVTLPLQYAPTQSVPVHALQAASLERKE